MTIIVIYSWKSVHINNINRPYYQKIDDKKGIDGNKSSASKVCDTCRYWQILNRRFKFQLDICNGCHGVLLMSISLKVIAILNIWVVDYCCIVNGIRKSRYC